MLIVLATSPRVAPGLLSWPAWQALRSASAVLAPAGHPLLPALDEAGIACRVECPWDSRQTHQSLAPHLLEETYEALEALESGDDRAFCEELGDVLLQVVSTRASRPSVPTATPSTTGSWPSWSGGIRTCSPT